MYFYLGEKTGERQRQKGSGTLYTHAMAEAQSKKHAASIKNQKQSTRFIRRKADSRFVSCEKRLEPASPARETREKA